MVIHYLYRRKCTFFQFLSRTYKKGIFRFLYYSSKITQNNYKKSFLENWCWWLLFWLDIKSTMLENISEQKIVSWEWINACTTRISFSKSAVVPTSVQEWVGVSRVSRKLTTHSESTQSRFLIRVDSKG